MTVPTPPVPGVDKLTGMAGEEVLGSIAQSKLGKVHKQRKHFGLTIWFKVVVERGGGVRKSLGEWSKCSGLGLSLKVEELRQGGVHDRTVRLPDEVSFPQITLERAVEMGTSVEVRRWLESVVKDWVNADDGGVSFTGNTVTVELYGAHHVGVIQSWVLKNAIPTSWSGPALATEGGGIAKESLTIVHDGFLNTSGKEPEGKVRIEVLESKSSDTAIPAATLTLPYNPTKVSLDKTAIMKSGSAGGGQAKSGTSSGSQPVLVTSREEQLVDPGKLSVKMNAMRIDGKRQVADIIPALFSLLEIPSHLRLTMGSPSSGGGGRGRAGKHKHGVYRVMLKSVNTSYTRFNSASEPVRAEVSLTFEEVTKLPAKQNPSSGARESGRAHTVTAGDSLPSIARESYGSPAEWRKIAEGNQVDDPLRVRNGSSLLLPDVNS